MHILRKFTYPTFIGSCSILASLADIIQNYWIFVGVVSLLLLAGLVFTLFPRSILVDRGLLQALGIDSSLGDSLRPFGVSCLVLATVMYGFSSLSARSADEGGIIASSFPELQEMQVALGVVGKEVQKIAVKTTEIKRNTDQLVDAAIKWVSLDLNPSSFGRATTGGDLHYFSNGIVYATISNDTGQIYEDIQILLKADKGEVLSEKIPLLLQSGYQHIKSDDESAHERLSVCLSGRRRGRDEWIIEHRTYQLYQAGLEDMPIYRIINATGADMSATPVFCGMGD